jgi:DNA-binding IclR family transcriptional regulator
MSELPPVLSLTRVELEILQLIERPTSTVDLIQKTDRSQVYVRAVLNRLQAKGYAKQLAVRPHMWVALVRIAVVLNEPV